MAPALSKYDLVCPTADSLPPIQDDLTVPQFILDSFHPTRPVRKHNVPWLIDDNTGTNIGFEEVVDFLCPQKACLLITTASSGQGLSVSLMLSS